MSNANPSERPQYRGTNPDHPIGPDGLRFRRFPIAEPPITPETNSEDQVTAFRSREKLIAHTTDLLYPYLDREGKVFYSGFDTYQSGRVIFLGYNPGGTGGRTLADHLRSIPEGSWNHFCCEWWGKDGKFNTLQKRTHNLFNQLGLDLNREVFTSNLYFQHTREASDLSRRRDYDFMKACISVVRHFLAAVPADLVICNGNGTFHELLGWLDSRKTKSDKDYEDLAPGLFGKRGRILRSIRSTNGRGKRIIGLPHLSWVPVGKNAQAVKILREQLAEQDG